MKIGLLKKGLIPAVMLVAMQNGYAAPVSPEKACDLARSFSVTHTRQGKAAEKNHYKVISSSPGAYYIVSGEEGGGFVIVGADDRIPAILGYTLNGNFSEKQMPPQLAWWLSEYRNAAAAVTENGAAPVEESMTRSARQPISPMLTTQWGQADPYNAQCPIDRSSGKRTMVGCVATAMAQVMKYHEWPDNPRGERNGYTFSGTTLDWANMLDNYSTAGGLTQAQIDAVALLSRQCGAAVDMQYGTSESGAYSNAISYALAEYFDYSSSMRYLSRNNFSYADWEELIYSELAAGRPVIYGGRAMEGGHQFVCDGYDGDGFYHFNWGWNGYQDGYFKLFNLNPAAGGVGSYAGGYNFMQDIVVGVEKAEGAQGPMQYCMQATGNLFYDVANSSITISGAMDYNIIYNTLSYPQTLKWGVKIVDKDGNTVLLEEEEDYRTYEPVQGISGLGWSMEGGLDDGEYRLYLVYKGEDTEWMSPEYVYGARTFIGLNVNDGVVTYDNEADNNVPRYAVLASTVEPAVAWRAGEPQAVRVKILNVGNGDFLGNVNLRIARRGYTRPYVLEREYVCVPALNSADVVYSFENYKNPGTYEMTVVDNSNNLLSEPIEITLEPSESGVTSALGVSFTSISPNFIRTDTPYSPTVIVANPTDNEVTIDGFVFEVASATDDTKVSFTFNTATVPAKVNLAASLADMDLGLSPGQYMMTVYDSEGKTLSLPSPLVIEDRPVTENGITYIRTSPEEAVIARGENGDYTGNVTIPGSIAGCRVKAIAGDAFTFAGELKRLTLPERIDTLQPGQFYLAESLERLTLTCAGVAGYGDSAFAEGMADKIALYTSEGTANSYKRSAGWDAFFFPSWTFDVSGYTITGLDTDPETGNIFDPYYVGRNEQLTFGIEGQNKPLAVMFETDGNTWGFVVSPEENVMMPALGNLDGRIWLSENTSGVDLIGASDDDEQSPVYNLQGIILKIKASYSDVLQMPAGIYIYRGKKIIIR